MGQMAGQFCQNNFLTLTCMSEHLEDITINTRISPFHHSIPHSIPLIRDNWQECRIVFLNIRGAFDSVAMVEWIVTTSLRVWR